MKLLSLLTALVLSTTLLAQEKDLRKASDLGNELVNNNPDDYAYFGNWQVIPAKSDAEYIDLMYKEEGEAGQYFILKPTDERSAISGYIDDGYHSVDLGFYAYRKGTTFYGNLDISVAIVFSSKYKGQLFTFECEYLKESDQLKLTTSEGVVFYLERQKD